MSEEVKTVTVGVTLTRLVPQTAYVVVRVPNGADDDWVRNKLSEIYENYIDADGGADGDWHDVEDFDPKEGVHEQEVDRDGVSEYYEVDAVPKCEHCAVEDVAEDGGRCAECAALYCPECGEEVEYDAVAGMCDACLEKRNDEDDDDD